jgi:hypothetical protein
MMLLKMGVCVSRLEYFTRRSLNQVERLWQSKGFGEPVLTSTFEGTHSQGSLHYANRAYDLRLPAGKRDVLKEVVEELWKVLGKEFFVLLEADHIHVQYNPK